ncbi:MAG: FHA domain-containing protein [Thermoanaerobacteraceae bacterium]|uniref:FHA domain-containing protein n=1 Tax=Thermanaeromonas sp. C210 TaxID=2731925 RepID=UPI00155CFD1C|nr:FHA domain-containing protein [Thermanaeromonas sp. C210]MBE3580760.1 FHA domain-containing protein [Thermoanaerobacteraceae bacterium]GFN24013.1 phosphopeptide-binding protein [Thermanaeromonas sp. C210]
MLALLMVAVRFGFLLLLYLFLFHVLRLLYHDLFKVSRRIPHPWAPQTKPVSNRRLTLQVREALSGNIKKGEIYPLGENIIIGRDQLSDIVLSETHVSGRHAAITRQGNRWQIRDLGSTNGTYVNGKRITGPVDLAPGDEVRIGGVIFEVRWENAGRSTNSSRLNAFR